MACVIFTLADAKVGKNNDKNLCRKNCQYCDGIIYKGSLAQMRANKLNSRTPPSSGMPGKTVGDYVTVCQFVNFVPGKLTAMNGNKYDGLVQELVAVCPRNPLDKDKKDVNMDDD